MIVFRVRVSPSVVLVQRRTGRRLGSSWRRYAVDNGVRRACKASELAVLDRFEVRDRGHE